MAATSTSFPATFATLGRQKESEISSHGVEKVKIDSFSMILALFRFRFGLFRPPRTRGPGNSFRTLFCHLWAQRAQRSPEAGPANLKIPAPCPGRSLLLKFLCQNFLERDVLGSLSIFNRQHVLRSLFWTHRPSPRSKNPPFPPDSRNCVSSQKSPFLDTIIT